ncbi:MAG TPA: ribosome assembly RNA-binding protein YhbY [bacterium]|nr:ribosome assembly RNA-binding protein YhbY [bacterium]
MSAALGGKQRRFLRGMAHGLDPVVMLGREGATDAVLEAIARELKARELIKVRLPELEGAERKAAAADLAESAGAELVQVLGRVVVLYREKDEEPRIQLPG